jgi:hypothetical protein
MNKRKNSRDDRLKDHSPRLTPEFSRFAHAISTWAGHPVTFLLAVAVVIVWAATGPLFGYGDTWQLVINTGTTILLSDGIPDPEHPESGYIGDPTEIVRIGPRDEGGGKQICRDRGPQR